ncbi:hypothetical protein BK816_01585 [Boudabousia tangfeifanii]|uniref:Predicted membrane protein YciQ-like C-terminal domain-containing protein n=1 Tax=Boudabousia tangfeifanii TaxID=1912795 RepID=A0A1D9MIW6_9ACTO|nr:DUF2207 domain-containing protein [Boudabousia tangfeifanii]AOZ72148.1 hypothetical protein BK816_01585 [Boudabousia tangfeifanii]
MRTQKRWRAWQRVLLALVLVCAPVLGVVPSAQAMDALLDLKIGVELDPDGNAHFTEQWTHVGDENTEFFKRLGRLGEHMQITNFSVSEGDFKYQLKPDWNVKASRAEKAGLFGRIDKRDGTTELCWGLGDPGRHVYTVRYTITNFVNDLTDAQAINWQFLNDQLKPGPEGYEIKVKSPLFGPETVTDLHAYGDQPMMAYYNNVLTVRGEQQVSGDDYLVVMAHLPAGTFNTKTHLDKSYAELLEQNNTRGKAFDVGGPSKASRIFWDIVSSPKSLFGALFVIFSVGMVTFALFVSGFTFISRNLKQHRLRRNALKQVDLPFTDYYRHEAPTTSVPVMWELTLLANDRKLRKLVRRNFVAFYLMKWTLDGDVLANSPGLNAGWRETTTFRFYPNKLNKFSGHEQEIYQFLLEAAGPNLVLERSELKKFLRHNRFEWGEIVRSMERLGKRWSDSEKLTESQKFGRDPNEWVVRYLSKRGARTYHEMVAFKRFLEDFTIIDEREIREVSLWKTYLVYATAFGCAERVLEQLRPVIPDKLAEVRVAESTIGAASGWSDTLYLSEFSRSDSSSSGSSSGGFSGGGGGSFGGSSGGGTR